MRVLRERIVQLFISAEQVQGFCDMCRGRWRDQDASLAILDKFRDRFPFSRDDRDPCGKSLEDDSRIPFTLMVGGKQKDIVPVQSSQDLFVREGTPVMAIGT